VLFRERDWPFRRDLLGWPAIVVYTLAALLFGFLGREIRDTVQGSLFVGRNFYGELRVRQYNNYYDWDGYRNLVHGSINHGEQYTHPARQKEPVTYYCADTGVGRFMAARVVGSPQRVALIGLGTGTLAAYGRIGDFYRFYEINPMVPRIAHTYFTYLKQSDALVDIRMGDARLSLERQSPQNYDLIAVDAFSSDAIPVHLLTREALALYFRHLKPRGVLAVHISNPSSIAAPRLSAKRPASLKPRTTTRAPATAPPGCSSPPIRRSSPAPNTRPGFPPRRPPGCGFGPTIIRTSTRC
jgi:protein-L-isoaspartate O-methyltransferase